MKAEELRKSILQMAIQGKLVPQDPNDEPASVLLERIRAEKQRLVKEGKIKKDKGDSIIFKGDDNCYYEKIGAEINNIDDEIDFDLPEGWAFCRISSILSIQTGAAFKKEQQTSNKSLVRVLRGGNILQGNYHFFDNDIFIAPDLVSPNILLRENDIITPAVTSIENIGKMALIDRNFNNVTAGGFVFILRNYLPITALAKYLLYALQSSYFCKLLKSITKKSGQAFYNLGKERLLQLIIPIPPIQEAMLISKKIEEFLPYLDRYNNLEEEATKLDDNIYIDLKKSILQFAIQGKLVPQDENDEPASVLLDRIRAEKKAQLGKKYIESYIYKGDDNCYYEKCNSSAENITDILPFQIPENWIWTRLATIVQINGGFAFKSDDYIEKFEGIRVLRISDFDENGFNNKRPVYHPFTTNLTPFLLQENDIIMCMTGGTVGKSYFVKSLPEPMVVNQRVADIKVSPNFNAEFVSMFIQSPYIQNIINENKNSTNDNISITLINSFLIPVPPIKEQHRIIEQIKKIWALI